ncbi:hypothetical protein LCGC14_2943720 [marine sediment metagenome]|uniref:Uncharacterized protein n=1 Tax=marine sediment metagenome TaxID=412755 RepID=A0A0F9A8A5_9ZZZZ
MRDYDLMLRCFEGHFIIDVRKAPYMFADAYCKGCKDWVPVDGESQMRRVSMALRRMEEAIA